MTSPTPRSSNYYQSRWRFAGMIAIAIAGLMAAGAIWTGILRDTAIHVTGIFSEDLPDSLVANTPLAVCLLYWAIFALAILAAIYLAFVDMRYIRLQYALEKQRLFQQSLGDELTRTLLEKDRDR